MTKRIFFAAITKFLLGFALVGVLIFLPAGTLSYFNGWLLMGILFVPMLFAGIVMMMKNPALLKSRLDAKEKQREQDLVIKLSGLMFILGFIFFLKIALKSIPNHPFSEILKLCYQPLSCLLR